jgi:hypothetical protein
MARSEDKEYELRRGVTFEQAEGIEPLPSQLQPKELSQALRVWNAVYHSLLDGSSTDAGAYTIERYFVEPGTPSSFPSTSPDCIGWLTNMTTNLNLTFHG